MGCNKICQAKKKAKKAEQQAAAGKRKASAAARNKPSVPGAPQVSNVSAEVTTVGDVLGVGEKYKALTPQEAMRVIAGGRRNPQVMGSAAGGLVGPISTAFGVYTGFVFAQKAMYILKPAVKIARQIGDVIFNFAAIGELLGDIAILLLTIFVGLAPIFLSLLRNIFFSIPVDIGILTEYQLNRLKELVELAKIDIKNAFQDVVNALNAYEAIIQYNIQEAERASLGGDINPPRQINYSTLSDALSDAISNATPPFTLADLLLNLTSGMTAQELADFLASLGYISGGIDDDDAGSDNGVGNGMYEIPIGFPPLTEDMIADAFAKAFKDGMDACREQILEELGNKLKTININILQIEGVSAFDTDDKLKAKEVANGLNEASQRIELLQAGEILLRQFSVSGQQPTEEGEVFDDIDLALAAAQLMLDKLRDQVQTASDEKLNSGQDRTVDVDDAFLEVFDAEVEKKKGNTVDIREDLVSLELAQEIILANKNAFINSMMNVINGIDLDSSGCVSLDPCYESAISTQFTDLKSTTQTNQTVFINNYTVNDTSDMLALRDSVFANVQQAVNDELITVDPTCQENFGNSVCDAISCFKSTLFGEIKKAVQAGSISIDTLDVPNGVDRYELKNMLEYLLEEVKKKIMEQTRDIIVEEVVPCKSCKPCEDMVADIGIYVSNSNEKAKDNIIKHVEGQIINNTALDWTITDAQSIVDKKNQLISQLNVALLRDAGELQLVDDMLFRLKAEEKELIKNVKIALQALTE